jgi:hypothetical protein
MLTLYQQLYQQMLQDIGHCKNKGCDILTEIECCFQTAMSYLDRISAPPSDVEKVEYYKHTKPLFLSERRYHQLHYFAAVFRPTTNIEELNKFWSRESNRFTRFKEENKDLFDYYFDGRTDRDTELFIGDPEDIDRYVSVLADFIALKRYKTYIEQSSTLFRPNE